MSALLLSLLAGCENKYVPYENEQILIEDVTSNDDLTEILKEADKASVHPDDYTSIAELTNYIDHGSDGTKSYLTADIKALKDKILARAQSRVSFDFPDQYVLDQRFISLTTTFDLMDHGVSRGQVSANFLSLTPTFTLTNGNGQTVATGKVRLLSIGTAIDVYDTQGQLIGTIKEEIWKNFGITTQYKILDDQGQVVAQSKKFQFLDTSFTIKDNSGYNVASIERPMFNLTGDNWSVNTNHSETVDPRIIALITPFKTFADQHVDDD